jgi:carbonic anhydrase/acetyltransferase-like protein (isoleucine patch superfamily)
MIRKESNKPLAVISYDTQTFYLLTKFVAQESAEIITRIEPDQFVADLSDQYQYINLVVKDFDLRKKISLLLDQNNLERWTFIGEDAKEIKYTIDANEKITVGKGCFIYPAVWMYSGVIGNDVIVHSMVKIAENVKIGNGTFISGDVTLAGSCTVGDWCFIGNNLFFIDNVSIADNVKLLPGTNIRKNIKESGVYYNPNSFKIERIIL